MGIAKEIYRRIGWGFFVMVIAIELASTVLLLGAMAISPGVMETSWFLMALTDVSIYVFALPLFMKAIGALPNSDNLTGDTSGPREGIALKTVLLLAIVAVASTIILDEATRWIVFWFESVSGSTIMDPLTETAGQGSLLVNTIGFVVVAPIMEELVFRKMLYRKLAGYGQKAFVFYSATMFALFHMNIYQIPYAFVVGALFAYVMWKSGKVAYSIFMHFLVNLMGSTVAPVLALAFGEDHGKGGHSLLVVDGDGIVVGVGHKHFRLARGILRPLREIGRAHV
jgi:membrane protease YdiL (CAAX protease family)